MSECPTCNYRNPSGVLICMMCSRKMDAGTRKNPSIYPVDYHSQSPLHRGKLALFDIDDTLYDATQREQNAVRAGLVVYGDRTPGELRKSTKPKGRKAFLDFFNSPEQFRTDTPFPGAVEYVRSLVNKGYTIAYLSGRDAKPMEATIEHLKETGFPIFKNNRGETMVYLKKNRKTTTDRYKYEKMRELQAEYDIHYFFDDLQKNRDKALSLGVIGVYHLPAHLGIKQNPARMNVPLIEQGRPGYTGDTIVSLITANGAAFHPHSTSPLKKQYYNKVLNDPSPLDAGEVIVLGGAPQRTKFSQNQHMKLKSLGYKIAGQGDINRFRQYSGSGTSKTEGHLGRGIYLTQNYWKPVSTETQLEEYADVNVVAIQFTSGLVMTNYQRVLKVHKDTLQVTVLEGNINNSRYMGAPRTMIPYTVPSAFFYNNPTEVGRGELKMMPTGRKWPVVAYFPMRLPPIYLEANKVIEEEADIHLTEESHMQRVVDSLPPGWRPTVEEKMGSFGPYQGPGDSWTKLNPPNTDVPAGYREAAGCMVQRASDGKILFLRRSPKETSKHGLYEFPGGKLEDGETAREAALIETEEEAGLKVKIIRQLDSHVDHTMKKVYHCFLAAPKKGARVKLSEEHDKFMWAGTSKKWPKKKLSHHARYMINQLHDSDGEYHKYIDKVHEILTIEGGAAGLSALKPAFPKKTSKKKTESLLAKMPGVVQHADGDYILVTGLSNPRKTALLPIMSGEPSGKHKKLGAVFAEVVIGRNVVKDVGEVVQSVYRGLIGGRTSMAEKRLAMGIASVQKELSDGATALGGNAVCNLKIDYEMIQGSQTITIIATADAIKMARPPKHPALPNPLPSPKKKNGRKEPSKNYVKRMMGNTKMRAEFPDSGQRYAVTLKLVEKHYGKAARKRIAPRDNGLFGAKKYDYQFRDSFGGVVSRGKKGPATIQGMKSGANVQATEDGLYIRYPDNAQPDWIEFSSKIANHATKRYAGPIEEVYFDKGHFSHRVFTPPKTFDEIMDSLPQVDDLPQEQLNEMYARYGISPNGMLDRFRGPKPVVITDNRGTQISQGTISTGSGVDVSVDRDNNVTLTYPESIMFNVKIKGLRTNNGTLPEVSLDKVGHRNQVKFNRDTGIVAQIRTEEQIASDVRHGLDNAREMARGDRPRSNPRKPLDGMEDKKVAKAKKAYKKFHGGKDPIDMKKETIDVGDVWYALGPCWSIGYMSPKETGEDDQKYIHHTNEDSKDGNFPMMYATMPEKGEPMIVIKGGSMKIGMRDGLAWLID